MGTEAEGQPSGARHGNDRVDWLVSVICEEIVSGVLQPGNKISEPQLASRLGVTRAPVREAIRRLEERRLVLRRPNTGVRVVDFSPQEFIDLLHMREGLEGIAARLAAQRISDEQVEALREKCADYAAAGDDHAARLKADLAFHSQLAAASGNAMLTSTLCDDFYAFFQIWRRRYPRLPGRVSVAHQQHLAILDAVAARDTELAEMLMRHHIKTSREAFVAIVGRMSDADLSAARRSTKKTAGTLEEENK